jgi:hypothetical protein
VCTENLNPDVVIATGPLGANPGKLLRDAAVFGLDGRRIENWAAGSSPNGSGRVSLRDALCGSRIGRDLLDGDFCQGIMSGWSSREPEASSALSDLSLMTS